MSVKTIVVTGSINDITGSIETYRNAGFDCVGGIDTQDGTTYYQLMEKGVIDNPYTPGDNMYSKVAINMYFTGSAP